MTKQSVEIDPEQTEGETVPHRRLVDKINAAALHALDHGRREIAIQLKLLHDAVVTKENDEGYADRSDDDLSKWLDHRFKSDKARKRVRPRRY